MNPILVMILLTLTPALELRASIPYAILATETPLYLLLIIIIVTNIVLGILIYEILRTVVHAMRKLTWFEKIFTKFVNKPQKKIQKAVDKWGELGVALFVGIPLPGSGVVTGAIGAYVIGLERKKFYLGVLFGVLIAATAVTLITLFGSSLFSWAIKT